MSIYMDAAYYDNDNGEGILVKFDSPRKMVDFINSSTEEYRSRLFITRGESLRPYSAANYLLIMDGIL